MFTETPVTPVLARHAARESILEVEKTFTLLPDRLVVESEQRPPEVYPLQSIRRVHLRYDRGRYRQYWFCVIDTDHGRVRIRNAHFAGLANVQDRRATYTPFVLQLIHQLRGHPNARMTSGSLLNFIGLIVAMVFIAIGLLVGVLAGNLMLIGVAAILLLTTGLIIPRMLPRDFTAGEPPRGLLPL